MVFCGQRASDRTFAFALQSLGKIFIIFPNFPKIQEPRFLNTPEGPEWAAIQFARHQLLANWLHDQGLNPEATAETQEDGENIGEEEEMNEIGGAGPSRALF